MPRAADRIAPILAALEAAIPEPKSALVFANPYQLLVAVILSAQCTDVRVNLVTPALFAKYPDARALANAAPAAVERFIDTCGLFRGKAKNLVATAKMLVDLHGGEVPWTEADLEALPGVGRKTANVVRSNAFGADAFAVDTHVGRVARRLGLTRKTAPDAVEKALCKLVAREKWSLAHHLFILHGRHTCMARKPACERCPVASLCPRIGVRRKT